MKYLISTLLLAAAAAGCASSKKPETSGSALDVGAGPAFSTTYTPPPQPLAAEPIMSVTPAPVPAYQPAAGAGAGTYTVKKGDTLYRIAREHYGDGKQWQKIAMANPGVTPQGLKAGQQLVIP